MTYDCRWQITQIACLLPAFFSHIGDIDFIFIHSFKNNLCFVVNDKCARSESFLTLSVVSLYILWSQHCLKYQRHGAFQKCPFVPFIDYSSLVQYVSLTFFLFLNLVNLDLLSADIYYWNNFSKNGPLLSAQASNKSMKLVHWCMFGGNCVLPFTSHTVI